MAGQYIEPVSIASMLAALPGQCSLCHGWGRGSLCSACSALVARRHRCLRCAIALPADQPLCGGCVREPPPFERTITALDYAAPWDGLIRHFKFHGQPELATPLARLLRDALDHATGLLPPPDLVLPAPVAIATDELELGTSVSSPTAVASSAD